MKKVNIKALVVSGIAAAVAFLILEIIIEYIFAKLFNISESMYYERFHIYPDGTLFHIINLSIFVAEMILTMYIYALIRSGFRSNISAGLMTSALFLALGFLLLANFANLGILTFSMASVSFFFNLLELPPAVLVGAVLYGEG